MSISARRLPALLLWALLAITVRAQAPATSTPAGTQPPPAALKPPVILKTASAPFGDCRATSSRQTVVGVVVSPAGLPTAESVAKSSGDACLDGKAIEAVHGYSFRPASLKGRPVSAAIKITVNFMQVSPAAGHR